jgi:hypothetical protein
MKLSRGLRREGWANLEVALNRRGHGGRFTVPFIAKIILIAIAVSIAIPFSAILSG